MHITIIADTVDNQRAGIHTYTKNLIKNLREIAPAVRFSYIHLKENSFFNDTDHHIVPRKKIPGYGSYRKFVLIPRLIKKLNPDIVWQPGHIGPFHIPKHIKKVVTIHDLTPILFPHFHSTRGWLIHKLLLGKTLRNADLILTPSQHTKSDLKKIYQPKAPISITPLGIDQPPTENLCHPYQGAPYLLYLGTIEPRKNLELLIDAYTELYNESRIHHDLVLAGEVGWKSDRILKKARQNPKIKITNYLNHRQKHAHLKHASAFIYPSHYEGFGLPPMEALAHGTPTICSNTSSLTEIYQNRANLFPPQNKEQLKTSILKTLKDTAQNHKTWTTNFSWQNCAEKTMTEFKNLTNR